MATFLIHGSDEPVHQARKHGADILVDDKLISVLPISLQSFSVKQFQKPTKIYAIVHGDSVYVQLHGRAARIDRVDPTRANAGATSNGGGVSLAPMPGVVVSLLALPGTLVKKGTPLLVIESMKLQMTIEATLDGMLEELPFAEGQTFQRGASLARVRPDSQNGAAV